MHATDRRATDCVVAQRFLMGAGLTRGAMSSKDSRRLGFFVDADIIYSILVLVAFDVAVVVLVRLLFLVLVFVLACCVGICGCVAWFVSCRDVMLIFIFRCNDMTVVSTSLAWS